MVEDAATRPLIAVPAYRVASRRVDGWKDDGIAVPAPYLEALRRAGGLEAVLMPAELTDAAAAEVLRRFDGLLLIGGGDLDPGTYHQAAATEVYGVVASRDAFEVPLARAAVARGLPTLAICRGHQVLNVALGGDLDQHITVDGAPHGRPGVEGGAALVAIEIDDGSRVSAAMGVNRAVGACHHHQSVAGLGTGLRVVARAPDGVVEAIETDGDAWIVGVQWHPEETAATDPTQQRLFDTLVRSAT